MCRQAAYLHAVTNYANKCTVCGCVPSTFTSKQTIASCYLFRMSKNLLAYFISYNVYLYKTITVFFM